MWRLGSWETENLAQFRSKEIQGGFECPVNAWPLIQGSQCGGVCSERAPDSGVTSTEEGEDGSLGDSGGGKVGKAGVVANGKVG